MYCMKCGANLPEGTAFCPKCGAEIEDGGGQHQGKGDFRLPLQSKHHSQGPRQEVQGSDGVWNVFCQSHYLMPSFFWMSLGMAFLFTRMFRVLALTKFSDIYQMPLYSPLSPQEFLIR